MTELTQRLPSQKALWKRIDRVLIAIIAILALLALTDPGQVWPTVSFAGNAIAQTGIFIAFAVFCVAYLKATGAETLLATAFGTHEVRLVLIAALVGGLSPVCSCEVIPFIAALLAIGCPLSAVMAFWLSSPLMDPAMFLITSGTLGWDFAIAKTVAAVGIGLMGGFTVMSLNHTALFINPLKEWPQKRGESCCGQSPQLDERPNWAFWGEASRRRIFRETTIDNALFLGKWLLLAYLIEALMLAYIPAELIATVLGGNGVGPILLGALVGAPAYLNGYAAVPLVDALLAQGMSDGAAMSFVIAGGMSSIPAAIAVWALVKPRVFSVYVSFAFIGAVLAGLAWNVVT